MVQHRHYYDSQVVTGKRLINENDQDQAIAVQPK